VSGVFNIDQITQRRGLADWYPPPNHPKEDNLTELRKDIAAALTKAGRSLMSSEIYDLIGTDVPRPKVMATIVRMKNDGEIEAFAGDSPRKTLYAITGATAAAPTAAAKPKKTKRAAPTPRTPRPADKKRMAGLVAALKPAAAAPPAAADCNVAAFTPALTDDDRLVIIRGTAALIFSHDQTRSLATLMRDHFGA
jgi:hypothetical protein